MDPHSANCRRLQFTVLYGVQVWTIVEPSTFGPVQIRYSTLKSRTWDMRAPGTG
jgi:hypothetical protein